MNIRYVLLVCASLVLLPLATHAAYVEPCAFGKLEIPLPNNEKFKDKTICQIVKEFGTSDNKDGALGAYVAIIANYLVGLTVAVAIIAVVAGGYFYMTAGGDGSKVELAKKTISAALIGVVLALTTYLILNTINPNIIGT